MNKFSWGMVVVGLIALLGIAPASASTDELTAYAYRDSFFRGEKKETWAVRVRFNHPVFPSNLVSATTVTIGEAPEKFELRDTRDNKVTTEAAREFRIVPIKPVTKPESVKITIDKSLSDATGRRLLGKDFSYQFITLEKIWVNSVTTFYRSPTEKGLQLSLSGRIDQKELAGAIKITPAVEGLSVDPPGYENNFRIKGNFELDRDYHLHVAQMTVGNGRGLLVAKDFRFKGPGLRPEITVRTDRSVVELKGRQLLPLTLSNVTKVRCRVGKIPAYLIPEAAEALRIPDKPNQKLWKEQEEAFKKLAAAGKVGAVFSSDSPEESEVYFAPEAKGLVQPYSLPLSFRKNPDHGGAYKVALSDPDGQMRGESTRIVQITDLAVSYKISGRSLLLWVTHLYTGEPVANAEVMLTDSEGSRYLAGKTDAGGVLAIKEGQALQATAGLKNTAGPSTRPVQLAKLKWAIVATDKDSCGIQLDQLRLKPFAVAQTSKLTDQPDARRGYAFTERGVYKPGETVHFKFVARAYKDHKIVSPKGEEVKVEITSPREDVVYSKELKLNEFGSCYDSLQVKSFFAVGTYTIRVTVKNHAEIAETPAEKQAQAESENQEENQGSKKKVQKPGVFTATFMVQEFKKLRHYASLSLKKEERPDPAFIGLKRDEEYLNVEVKGLYYTGGPVKNARVRWKTMLVPVVNKVQGLEGYLFGNEDEATRFLESGESTLDGQGKLDFKIPLDPKLLTGIYGVKVSATVLDVDGEPATEVETFNPKPKFLVGVSGHPRQVQSGYASPLRIVVVDESGKKIPSGKVEAAIMEKKYFNIHKRDDEGNLNYQWEEGWMKTLTSQLSLENGEGVFPLELNDSGNYMVAFTYEAQGGRYTSQTVFKVGWEDYDNWMQSRMRSEKATPTSNEILVALAKNEYRVGEPIQVQFHTPRPVKKCLVTVEKGEVLEYKVIDVKGADGTYEFTAKEGFQPNVFVSVMAPAGREGFPVYASQADTDIPMVYYGYADISIRSESQKLRLDIDPGVSDLKGRPAETKTINFKVTDQSGKGIVSELAVCVVDEAVLALTRFQTPELSTLTKFNIPLAVFSGDLRLALVSQDLFRLFSTRPLTGGGVGMGEVSASLRKDFRPVAYFNPALVTDGSGMAKIEFKLPDTTTAYRVYAVVCDRGSGFVSGQRNMVVTKEFFVEPSLPRFAIPGDRFTFPVVVNNKTGEQGEATLEAKASKDLTVKLAQSAIRLEPWSSAVVKAMTEVAGGTDRGTFTFSGKFIGKSGQYTDAIELTLPIHSRYRPVHRASFGDFVQQVEITAAYPEVLKKLKPEDVNLADFKAHLSLSTTNWARIAPGLKYLLTYPYGCVEQTSSGVIPLAGIRGLVKSGAIPGIEIDQVDKFLKGGVERLLSMQLADGGFAYWPGQLNASWWGTMYATFALTAAREAGFDVPADRMDLAMKFLRGSLFEEKGTDEYHSNAWTKEFAVLNLATDKQLTSQELDGFFAGYDSLSNQSKALLLIAAKKIGYLTGKKRTEMVNKLDPKPDPSRSSYTDSSFREIAICLMAGMELGATRPKEDAWAGFLLRGLKPDGKWASTADTGWCLLALSKYYEARQPKKTSPVRLKVNYGAEKPMEVQITDASAYLELDPRVLLDQGKIRVESDSKDALINYTLSLTYPDMATDPGELSRGFALVKKMENLNGQKEIRVGDVVRVTLEISLNPRDKAKRYDQFDYLALEDPVPAGIVPINSELKTEGVEAEKSSREGAYRGDGFSDFTPSYFEFRDDSVRVFKNHAWTGNFRYSYLARAVAEGDFWMPGSRISLMYAPDTFGKTLGERVRILSGEK
ncbi:MAG: hypothetical protein HY913_21495 [Desulfomonile tiedjei]|nr:hypothetical protein [Desulfomonile tiedjei]